MRWRRRSRRVPPGEAYRSWSATYGEEPNPLQRLEHEALEGLLTHLDGATVLDVGCGRGRVAGLAAARGAERVVGIDLTPAMVARASGLPRAVGRVEALPFGADRFDLVTCALVLGHVETLEPSLGELCRLVRPGGRLVVSDFHPCATLRGWERTFVERSSGRTVRIEQHAHLLAEYVGGLVSRGFEIEALREPTWEGFPVVFVLAARRTDPERE